MADSAADVQDEPREAPVKRKVVYGKKKPAAKKPDAAAQQASEAAAAQEAAEAAHAAEAEARRLEQAAEQQRLAEEKMVSSLFCSCCTRVCMHKPLQHLTACFRATSQSSEATV